MKNIIFIALIATLSSCANFKVNAPICNDINNEPNTQNIPKECRNYNKKEADKAFFKNKEDKKADVDDIIEFNKDKKEEK
jgi:hypothetical protein